MSAQTNAFQKAILFIHDQIKDAGASVTESASLPEYYVEGAIDREIDVLIEKMEHGAIVRIAIECRDRRYKDDIQWIDSLIGKYKNLPVIKVIGVSNSGFSRTAEIKARANAIELRTVEELKNVAWNEEFLKLGICDFQIKFDIKGVYLETADGKQVKATKNLDVEMDGHKGSFEEIFKAVTEEWRLRFRESFNKKMPEIYKTREDLSRTALIENRIPFCFNASVNDVTDQITAIVLQIIGHPEVKDLPVKPTQYQGAIISKAEIDPSDQLPGAKIYASQALPKGTIQISWDKKPSMPKK